MDSTPLIGQCSPIGQMLPPLNVANASSNAFLFLQAHHNRTMMTVPQNYALGF